MINKISCRSFDLVTVLLSTEFKLRYNSTVLGYVWSILNPLIFAMIYFFAFKIALRVQIDNYAMFLLSGLFPWQAMQNSLNTNSNIFLHNGNIIKNTIFPKWFLPFVVVLNDLLQFVLSVPILILGMYYYNCVFNLSFLYIFPVIILIQFLLTLGLSLFLASLNIFLRDMERLITLFTVLWFFATPIIYKEKMLPEVWRWILYVNPASGIIVNWRNIFMGEAVNYGLLGSSALISTLMILVGAFVYRKLSWRFAEVV